MLPGIQLCVQNVEFFCIDFKVSIAKLLKNPSRQSSHVQEQSIWSLRLPQEMQKRSLGKAHTSSWDSISSNNLLVRRICCFPSFILVGDQAPRRKDDGTDFWMRLNKITPIRVQVGTKNSHSVAFLR
jgi:hypothetical protein